MNKLNVPYNRFSDIVFLPSRPFEVFALYDGQDHDHITFLQLIRVIKGCGSLRHYIV